MGAPSQKKRQQIRLYFDTGWILVIILLRLWQNEVKTNIVVILIIVVVFLIVVIIFIVVVVVAVILDFHAYYKLAISLIALV